MSQKVTKSKGSKKTKSTDINVIMREFDTDLKAATDEMTYSIKHMIEDGTLLIKTQTKKFRAYGEPTMVTDKIDKILSSIIRTKNFKWDNIIISGGFILQCANQNNSMSDMMQYLTTGDIDFYIHGIKDVSEYKEKISYIFEEIRQKSQITSIIRTKNAFTINLVSTTGINCKVQIILGLFANISDIFKSYDIKVCCMAYDGANYIVGRSAQIMTENATIIIDCKSEHTIPFNRAIKYYNRGFNLRFINFTTDNIVFNSGYSILRFLTTYNTDKIEENPDVFIKNQIKEVCQSYGERIFDDRNLITSYDYYLQLLRINPYLAQLLIGLNSSMSTRNGYNVRNYGKRLIKSMIKCGKTTHDLLKRNIFDDPDTQNEIDKIYNELSESLHDAPNKSRETKELKSEDTTTVEENKDVLDLKKIENTYSDNVITYNQFTKYLNKLIDLTGENTQKITIVENSEEEYYGEKPSKLKYNTLKDAITGHIKHSANDTLSIICGTVDDFSDIIAGRIPKMQLEQIVNDWSNAYINDYLTKIKNFQTKLENIKKLEYYIEKFKNLIMRDIYILNDDSYITIDTKIIIEKKYAKWY